MPRPHIRVRQVVDWSAALWAGLVAGSVLLLLSWIVAPMLISVNGWVVVRLFASGEKQFVALAPQQEIALGLQATPEMMEQHGGLDPDPARQELIDRIGFRLVERTDVRGTPWKFEFHLLADPRTVNAFALPGGQRDELESDTLGVMIMAGAGYDPRSMLAVMDVLEAAGGGARKAEFFSTHPSPDNRRGEIREAIDRVFPNGVPDGLIP